MAEALLVEPWKPLPYADVFLGVVDVTCDDVLVNPRSWTPEALVVPASLMLSCLPLKNKPKKKKKSAKVAKGNRSHTCSGQAWC